MAFKISAEGQTVFFGKVFGPSNVVTSTATILVQAGVTFEVGLFNITATYKGKVASVTMTVGATALMKGTIEAPVAVQNKKLISDWMKGLASELNVGAPESKPTIYQKTDAAKVSTEKPVPSVIHLKDAKALGQQVHGTSTGSVYYTIALSEHVKVAARLYKSGSISIRAEWTDTPTDELAKLSAAGVGMKGNYGSIHFDASGVPIERVVGAFLVGTGIKWKSVIMSGADLVIGEAKF